MAYTGQVVYFRARDIKAPLSQEFRGVRLEVAVPNMAGHKPFSNEQAPSFMKPYLIVWFGDYESYEKLESRWINIVKALHVRGFDKLVNFSKEWEPPNLTNQQLRKAD